VTRIELDERGFPVLLADRLWDESIPNPIIIEHSVSSLELARRRDAVREAAREFEDLSDQDIRERLRGRTSRELIAGEVSQFRSDVRQQVIDDLVDALDHGRRGKLRKRRMVRVVAPKGYTRKVVNGLNEEERSDVEARLLARGWGEVDVREVLGIHSDHG